jgi:HSP20 family protein
LTREDIKIDLDDGKLTISAEKKESTGEGEEGEEKSQQKREQWERVCSFSHQLSVPEGVTPQDVSAKMENGLLITTVQKPVAPAKEKKATIQIQKKPHLKKTLKDPNSTKKGIRTAAPSLIIFYISGFYIILRYGLGMGLGILRGTHTIPGNK